MFAVWAEQVDRAVLAEPGGVQIAALGFLVHKDNNHLLVRRSWGAIFQGVSGTKRRTAENLPISWIYVMLSKFSCQPTVFIRVRPGVPPVDRKEADTQIRLNHLSCHHC